MLFGCDAYWLGRQNVTVIPPEPGVIVIGVVRRAASPGVTMSDVLRWGEWLSLAVIGAVLATPHGMASLWRAGQRSHRRALAFGRRLLRRPKHIVVHGSAAMGGMGGDRRGQRV